MSALASLVRAYDRLAERHQVPVFGYSQEKIGFLISLNENGTPAGPPIDLREIAGKKRLPRLLAVPQPVKRTSGIAPNFLWDKTAYVLGITAGQNKRTEQEHAAFAARHQEWLAQSADPGLLALKNFLQYWTPEKYKELGWPEDMQDQNIVFTLESERLHNILLHDRPLARELWARLSSDGNKTQAACLITGKYGPVTRLHPAIKGVWGAQTAGASIVSFNLDAFTSYEHEHEHEQGLNAPVSEAATFAYTTTLNHYLEKGSAHRIQIGDASTVFWADAANAEAAGAAETVFAAWFGQDVNEEAESKKAGAILEKIRTGRPIEEIRPELPEGVRFFVLGLSPNAARLSVRFYLEDDFGIMAERYLKHIERMKINPPPKEEGPSMWRLLIETAVLRKTENIQPNLAGEWMRAILGDTPYPLTLLSTLIMRLRADHDVNALRVAILNQFSFVIFLRRRLCRSIQTTRTRVICLGGYLQLMNKSRLQP